MVTPLADARRAMRPQRNELMLAALIGTAASLCAVALLGTSAWLISRAAEMPPVLTLSVAAVSVRFFALGRAVFRYAERLVGHNAAFKGLSGLRVAVYERLERIAPIGMARFTRGDVLSRLVGDVDTMLDWPLRVVLPWVQAVLVALATTFFLFTLQPLSALIVGVALALGIVAVPWLNSAITMRVERQNSQARAELTGAAVSALMASADVLAFDATERVRADVASADARLTSLARRSTAALGLTTGIGVLIQGATVVLALLAAIPAVTSGAMPSVWLAVVALLPIAAYDVVAGLPAAAMSLHRVVGAADRISSIDNEIPIADPQSPVDAPTSGFSVELRNVTARWTPDGPNVLHGVSLTVHAGERVAIVGPSGSGKSTIAAILQRFCSYEGSVRIAGVEAHDLTGDDVRLIVGGLAQEAYVFDTTVADNLRLGNPTATNEQLLAILSRVGLAQWVAALPDGLATEVGTLGRHVSGGERQRLSLARLLLADRPVVVLDEPTEHLDPEAARELAGDLLTAADQRTTIIVTHRLSDCAHVDRIAVLIDGRITESGTHEELIALNGWYFDQWTAEQQLADLGRYIGTLPVGQAILRTTHA